MSTAVRQSVENEGPPQWVVVLFGAGQKPSVVKDWLQRVIKACGPKRVLICGWNESVEQPLEMALPGARIRLVNTTSTKRVMQQAAQAALDLGASHVLALDVQGPFSDGALHTLTDAVRKHPQAIVTLCPPRGAKWSWSRLTLRLQTGEMVRYPLDSRRVYPAEVLRALPVWSRGNASWNYEVLVRAAWGGIQFVEVTTPEGDPRGTRRPVTWGDRAWLMLLNIHLSMRSITPWPHPRLRDRDDVIAPKISLWHFRRSLRTLLTAHATPPRLGLATALGVFLGALPLIAAHSVSILLAAGFLRLNKAVALAASQICMPPIVPALCIELGYFMRQGRFLTEISIQTLGYQALDRLLDWLLGALVVGPVLAALAGSITYGVAQIMRREMEARKQQVKGG